MMEKLTETGQIENGDVIHCEYKGKPTRYVVMEVLFAGTDREEILVNKKKNLYFITAMAVDGSSWAKMVHFGRPI